MKLWMDNLKELFLILTSQAPFYHQVTQSNHDKSQLMEVRRLITKYIIHQHQAQPSNSKSQNKIATRNGKHNQLTLKQTPTLQITNHWQISPQEKTLKITSSS